MSPDTPRVSVFVWVGRCWVRGVGVDVSEYNLYIYIYIAHTPTPTIQDQLK